MAKINVTVSKMGIIMLLFFTWVAIVAGKIDGKIDLVIIAPAANVPYLMDLFKASIQDLHNQIVMGDDKKVRVAVVEPAHTGSDIDKPGAQIVLNMSSNQRELENWAKNWKHTNWEAPGRGRIPFWHSEAFKLADMIFFNKTSDKSRAKMIIQVVNGMQPEDSRQEAHDEAKKLRDKGVLIYVTYDEDYNINYRDEYMGNVRAYIGINYTWRMHGSKGIHDNLFQYALRDILSLTAEITRDLCTFCKFTKNQAKCSPDKRPKGSLIDFFGDENARCKNVNPVGIPCPMEECEFECNRQWQWDSVSTRPCNDRNAKPCVDRHKRQPPKPPPGMENCLKEMKCNWTCPTTTTTTTTTVHPPTHKALPQQDSTSKSDDSMPMSLIILLAVIGVVVILVIVGVLIVVIVSRRSSAAKRKAMEDLVNAKKKRAEDREKHRHRGFAMDRTIGLDDSVGVSMVSTAEIIKQGKFGDKSMASPSKMKGAKSMASPGKKGGKSTMSPSIVKTRSKSPARKK